MVKQIAASTPESKNTHLTTNLKSLTKSILELYPDEETNPTLTCILSEFIFTNSKIIDRSDHWSLLLFKEALAIRRLKPELNHGTKASKELV